MGEPSTNPCDYVVPNGTHCSYPCPGCGAPTYAADGACPTGCAEAYDWLPKTLFYGCDETVDNCTAVPGVDFHDYAIEDEVGGWRRV